MGPVGGEALRAQRHQLDTPSVRHWRRPTLYRRTGELEHGELDLEFVAQIVSAFKAALQGQNRGEGTLEVALVQLAGDLGLRDAPPEEGAGAGDEAELPPDHERKPQGRLARADQCLEELDRPPALTGGQGVNEREDVGLDVRWAEPVNVFARRLPVAHVQGQLLGLPDQAQLVA